MFGCSKSYGGIDYTSDDPQYNTKIIAHRGFWNCSGSAENSISSLVNAQKIEVYGSEFDVWLTSDNVAVIHHDAIINGLVIEKSLYSQIKDFKLSNGEKIPTLENYLNQGRKSLKTKLIMEIKPYSNVQKENSAVSLILGLVKKYAIESNVEFISFSYNICTTIKKEYPKSIVCYLGGNLSPAKLKESDISGLDYDFNVINKNINWFDDAKKMKLRTMVWTVDNDSVMQEFISKGVDCITTNNPIKLFELLKKMNAK